ncbi:MULTISPECIES: PAS domain-containing hybrid sensor histidine kinase/response regulator [unclassified Ketobacter]|uniref:PAS domain-containing hybrid sensor histidine kinase/response regulator n=1 Tax=unclassified Ketobacter TaxID=2639109 RepID=UPI000F182EC0|nr:MULTISPECIES: PAS domain-containing hybrid sensor histidine kinase/response regulator [unclassified Ketobacter]RLT87304.1 MAG: response regulator [Ketobacter sp. GenoA1]RLT93418.1 MAG: response regulator [Ketobacter sp.]
MFSVWTLAGFALAYTCILFLIAWYGDRRSARSQQALNSPWLYSLTLAVYCTSWTFFGAVGQAANFGWDFLPIYLGPMIVFILGTPMLFKIIAISKQQGITSIADFIASRYGKSQPLAILITLVAIAGTIPYITLQLKAVTMAFDSLTNGMESSWPINSALAVALLMAMFAVLFGTRHIDASEHQNGLMLAIGFESLVKLFAFVVVGVFVVWQVFGGIGDLFVQLEHNPVLRQRFSSDFFDQGFFTQTLLAMAAIICLPRQFHTTVVENRRSGDLHKARWLFPGYLLLFTLFVVPIAMAGLLHLPEQIGHADRYILSLPMHFDQPSLALLSFLGGVSAATGMVIVSSVALSIMVCNELVIPIYLNRARRAGELPRQITPLVRKIRRVSIFVILLLAYLLNDIFAQFGALASIGLLSFAAVAQFAPVLVGGLYWKQGHKRGAALGILSGFSVWFYCLLLPVLLPDELAATLQNQGLLGLGLIRPYALFGLEGLDPLSHGVFWSLAINIFCYIYFSKTALQETIDRNQAILFVDVPTHYESLLGRYHAAHIRIQDLQDIAGRCLGRNSSDMAFAQYAAVNQLELDPKLPATVDLFRFTEKMLARVMGASSARVLLGSMLSRHTDEHSDAVAMIDEAAELIQFNHQLLQTTIETISHGICVVDKNLNIVAWNRTYIKLFEYPDGLIQLGRPIADVYRYNAHRGFYPAENEDQQVQRRVNLLKQGGPHRFERELPNGIIVEVRGNPMPDGGFVSTFLDITESKMDERALRQMNESLEMMVSDRTQKLSELNAALHTANEGKTRFLAAAGHDLMQPLNAAHLFTSSLQQRLQLKNSNLQCREELEILQHIDNSLHVAEHLINTLLDISRLDTGTIKPNVTAFDLHTLLTSLASEFDVIAAEKGLQLRWVDCHSWVHSDDKLLRRVLQNLLLNAVRYTPGGRILLGCRRRPGAVDIQIWDTGVGIPDDQIEHIFKEFHRIKHRNTDGTLDSKGLGLGLAIAQRISQLLQHPLSVHSRVGKGTVFSIRVPTTQVTQTAQANQSSPAPPKLSGLTVFCVDNEPMILSGVESLLNQWQCISTSASSLKSALEKANTLPRSPDALLVDYQLDDETGFDVIDALDECWEDVVPAILMTADHAEAVKLKARERGYYFLQKPITPEGLQAALSSVLTDQQ